MIIGHANDLGVAHSRLPRGRSAAQSLLREISRWNAVLRTKVAMGRSRAVFALSEARNSVLRGI